MWTEITRPKYERDGLRYARGTVPLPLGPGLDIGQRADLSGSLSRWWTSPRESAPLRGSALTPDDGRDHHAPGMVCQPVAADQGSALRHRPQMIFQWRPSAPWRRKDYAGRRAPQRRETQPSPF